ncbi:hypothetical protein [Streptomyces sp. NPDC054837]
MELDDGRRWRLTRTAAFGEYLLSAGHRRRGALVLCLDEDAPA